MARLWWFAMVCGLAAPASASPASDPTAGRAVFTGATTAGATSIDLDPAALGIGTETDEAYFAGMAVIDHTSIDRDSIDLATGALSPAGRVRDTGVGPGAMIAYILHLKDRATLAVELRSAPWEEFPSDHA